MTLRQALNSAAGLALLAGVAYCSYGYFTAESRVKALCASIPKGSTADSLAKFASLHGLSDPSGHNPDFLVERRTFGRYGCKLHWENGVLTQSEYNFAD